jgi:Protein of unknown function, DUF488
MMIATCSYKGWREEMGVPVRTSVGAPRAFPAPLVEWPVTYPVGLLEVTDPGEFRRRYRHRLHSKTPRILAELQELREGYDQPIVLLCFEDLSKPGAWCHRALLGEWISQKTGEEVPELG